MRLRHAALLPVLVLAITACTSAGDEGLRATDDAPSSSSPQAALASRLQELEVAVAEWAEAEPLRAAQAAAEEAANLVVGPDGPGFGDRNDDEVVGGRINGGLLPDPEGEPEGAVVEAVRNGAPSCVERDVLGGAWSDPAARWAEVDDVLARWSPATNTMPELDSHLQRVVGWARLALDSDDLDQVREYAGHAALHVDVSQQALDC